MNYPAWLGELSKKDEMRRASEGLWPARDGWYKTIDGKKRYICKPMKLADALTILPHRADQIRGKVVERPIDLEASTMSIKRLAEVFLAHLWDRVQHGGNGVLRKMDKKTGTAAHC